jgi:DNA-binding LacI/PurR family transcriptional regulator
MKEFEVSQFTVDRALDLLLKENLIVKHPKGRTYVGETTGESRATRKHSIVIAVPNYPSSIYETYITYLNNQVQRIGDLADVIRYDWRDRVIQKLPKQEIDALILIPTSVRLAPADLYGLSKFQIPVVLISRLIRDFTLDCVEPDNEMGAALAAEHLIRLGHQKLAILQAEPAGVSSDFRIAGFVRKAESLGIDKVEIIDSKTQPGENSAVKAYDCLKSRIQNADCSFTGLFVLSDGTALGAIKALHDCRIAIPGQVSIVGFDDAPEAALYHPALTTIRGDYEEVARTAVEIIERRLGGDRDGTIQRMIPPTLVKRESTGPAPKS